MKRIKSYLTVAAIFAAISAALVCSNMAAAQDAKKAVSAADKAAEEQKKLAKQNPYPNDLGPAELDAATIKSYPPDTMNGVKEALAYVAKNLHGQKEAPMPKNSSGYALLLVRCSACHSSSRPLNSRFTELAIGAGTAPAAKAAAEAGAVAKMKTAHPEMFKNPGVWQIEAGIWSRYVHRMMNKPGCPVDGDGKKIWEFLVYDGNHRKLGDNAAAWQAHREDLLKQFKAQNPKRYDDLAKDNDL